MSLSGRLLQSIVFPQVTLPSLARVFSACERVFSRWPDVVVEPAPPDREQLVLEMRVRLDRNDWEGARMSRVISAARALFDEDRRDREDMSELRAFYYDEIRASDRPVFLSAMFSVFIGSYAPDAAHTVALSSALKVARKRLSSRWQQLLENIPECLDPGGAPEAVAARMVSMDNPWGGLKQLGLRSPHAPGLMDFAHLRYVEILKPKLAEKLEIERLVDWLRPKGGDARSSGGAEAVGALLKHWIKQKAPQDIEKYLTEQLVSMYGDPRVNRGGIWSGVPEAELGVIVRWLTGANIHFFLDVVSEVEDSHMWEPRRNFWLSLHRQGRITGAWVAFSARGTEVARERLGLGGREDLRFGRQTAGGSRGNTSLLILQIDSKVVVEGSHNYKVHIFNASDPKTPRLYRNEYDCEAIRITPGSSSKSHLGDWENWVLENI